MKTLKTRLLYAFELTRDLVQHLSDDNLKLKLKDMPSNAIGEQIWCIVGARESYLKAVVNQGWVGFSCSLDTTTSKDRILLCLDKSASEWSKYLASNELNEIQQELLISLFEHEIQHHGQLIRYFYGNKLTFPKSWSDRYTV